FVAVGRVRLAMIFKVVHSAIHAILKTTYPSLSARLPRSVAVAGSSTRQFRGPYPVSAYESVAILIAQAVRNRRMAKLIAIIGIGTASVAEVLDRPFHPIFKAALARHGSRPRISVGIAPRIVASRIARPWLRRCCRPRICARQIRD